MGIFPCPFWVSARCTKNTYCKWQFNVRHGCMCTSCRKVFRDCVCCVLFCFVLLYIGHPEGDHNMGNSLCSWVITMTVNERHNFGLWLQTESQASSITCIWCHLAIFRYRPYCCSNILKPTSVKYRSIMGIGTFIYMLNLGSHSESNKRKKKSVFSFILVHENII